MGSEYNCRVCGLEQDELPWGEDGKCPNYDICDCCGVEFGNEDYTYDSTIRYRKEWIEKGAIWSDEKRKPSSWDLNDQLSRIPEEYQ